MNSQKEIVSYVLFGVLTTLVNIFSYILLTNVLQFSYPIAVSIAWFVSVLFAYYTNRQYVFSVKGTTKLWKEVTSFFMFRLASYFLDIILMVVLIEVFLIDDLLSKIIVNVLIVILNYLASKFVVFKKKEDDFK
jgi:putative flippase GtrA